MNGSILNINEIKERCYPVFLALPFVKKAFLFGSYAKGTATEKSDVDFIASISENVGLDFFILYDRLSDVLGKRVDVLTEAEADNLPPNGVRERIKIFERPEDER